MYYIYLLQMTQITSGEIEKYECLGNDNEEDCTKSQLFHSFKMLITNIPNPKRFYSENRISGGEAARQGNKTEGRDNAWSRQGRLDSSVRPVRRAAWHRGMQFFRWIYKRVISMRECRSAIYLDYSNALDSTFLKILS